jgi:hypothetical protein
MRNLFIEHLLDPTVRKPVFPFLQPTPTIHSRNTSIEDARSNPKWVLFITPQTSAIIALERKIIGALEECTTIWNYSAKFNNG